MSESTKETQSVLYKWMLYLETCYWCTLVDFVHFGMLWDAVTAHIINRCSASESVLGINACDSFV